MPRIWIDATKSCPPPASPGVIEPARGRLNSLVVEDHIDLHVALANFLQLLDYKVRFAMDVASALRLAAAETFDVLLSDIGLPDGDGWELRRRLIEVGCCPPLTVAMSGFGAGEHAAQSAKAGFARFLPKPFTPEALAQALGATIPWPVLSASRVVKREVGPRKQLVGSRISVTNFPA